MKMEHETKNEWMKRQSKVGKLLYLIGCFKLKDKSCSLSGKWRYTAIFRKIHPISWLFMLLILIVGGFKKEAFQYLKGCSEWW